MDPQREDWRTRQFVPDSDEEEDSQVDPRNAAILKSALEEVSGNSVRKNGYGSEDELGLPLEKLPRGLGIGGVQEEIFQDSQRTRSISPLSSLSSSPAPPSPETRPAPPAHDKRSPSLEISPAEAEILDATGDRDGQNASIAQQLRHLRPRNPEQLNPYSVELLKYQMSLKSRGMRPVKIREAGTQSKDATQGQDGEWEPEARPEPSVRESSPLEELPDLASLLESGPRPAKKRKMSHRDASNGRLSPISNDLSSGPLLGPQSSSPVAFQPPIGLAPRQLETPAVSSDHKKPSNRLYVTSSASAGRSERRRRPIVLDDSDSDGPEQLLASYGRSRSPTPSISKQPNIDFAESSESEASEQENVRSDREIIRAQKRIRGVLPASWIRLDQQKQARGKEREERPKPETNAKGVARKIGKQRSSIDHDRGVARKLDRPRDNVADDLLLFESASEEEPRPEPQPLEQPSLDLFWGDVDSMEDNRVDYMLAGSRANGSGPRPKRSRQTKITDHPHKASRRKPASRRTLKLSVVDVAEVNQAAPNFLKIANRTATKRRGKGRHSPSRKVFEMATQEDSRDLQSVLEKWKSRELSPIHPKPRRKPSNPTNRAQSSRKALGRLDPPQTPRQPARPAFLESPPGRVSASQANIIQETIDRIVERMVTANRLNNRPQGALQSAIAPPLTSAPAILEAPRISRKSEKVSVTLQKFFEPELQENLVPDSYSVEASQAPEPKKPRVSKKRTPRQLFPAKDIETPELVAEVDDAPGLAGLGRYGTTYTTDFDIEPFPSGPCFGRQTLLGRGTLERAKGIDYRQLDSRQPTGNNWSTWNETVACELRTALEDDPDRIIDYFSSDLCFADSVDRSSMVGRCISLLKLREPSEVKDLMSLAIMAYQIRQISDSSAVDADLRDSAQSLFRNMLSKLVSSVFSDGFSDLLKFQKGLSRYASADPEHATKAEALVVAMHLSDSPWDFIGDMPTFQVFQGTRNVQDLEQRWLALFTLNPFWDVGTTGCSQGRSTASNWPLVKRLMEPVFEHCRDSRGAVNEYCRALYGRCLRLIQDWHWPNPEQILPFLYDFFAQNSLENLHMENSRGSPAFLGQLDARPNLMPRQSDSCFHLFLKALCSGLKDSTLQPRKKRNLACRMMPNHSRLLAKDRSVRPEDLDALQNHHDLLSVLYYASPPGFRPRVTIIRHLIEVEKSHREACKINIRTWQNLVKFQLSIQETAGLDPLVDWIDGLLSQVCQQHMLARKEMEGSSATKEVQEQIIASNQRQIESVLSCALSALSEASKRAPEQAQKLLVPALARVMELFEAQTPRIQAVVSQALEILLAFSKSNQTPQDDSQGFGDWSAFAELDPSLSLQVIPQPLYESLHSLLSNAFGAGVCPGDRFLELLLDTWVGIAQLRVNIDRSWSDYIGAYGKDSWGVLRDTEQKSKFTPLFLTILIDKEPEIYREHQETFLAAWVVSLVERESRLKYQHRLTTALLNCDAENPLLSNLPFAGENNQISLEELRGRRLSLLSTVLSNMRESLDFNTYHNMPEKDALRLSYVTILKETMKAMRENYQMLGGHESQSVYVQFAQSVVGFLHQHTVDICPIDRFFTDAHHFPLPTDDPTYVVVRLKRYGLRLGEPGIAKQLATFVQNISEQAAIDRHHERLTQQLADAMLDSNEEEEKMSLRAFIVEALVPAYTTVALSTPCGWCVALPLLQSLAESVRPLCSEEKKSSGTTNTILSLLQSIVASAALAVDHTGLLDLPQSLRVLKAYLSAARAVLPIVSLPVENEPRGALVKHLSYLRSFAKFASAVVRGRMDASAPRELDVVESGNPATQSTESYALGELQASLKRYWRADGNRYETCTGGGGWRDVVALDDTEKDGFLESATAFESEIQRYSAFETAADAVGASGSFEVKESQPIKSELD